MILVRITECGAVVLLLLSTSRQQGCPISRIIQAIQPVDPIQPVRPLSRTFLIEENLPPVMRH